LDANLRSNSLRDTGHCSKVIAGAERAIQIYDVNPPGTLVDEFLGHRDRIIPVNSLPRRLALTQANDAAGSNVDSR
jgi:hypothetical protein